MEYGFFEFEKDICIRGLHTFFYYEHNKNYYFGGERHDFWEMVYVDSGEIDVVADNIGYVVKQGEVIMHKPMEFHTLAANKKDPHNVIVLSFETDSAAIRFFENKIFAVSARQKKILSLLLEEAKNVFGETLNIIIPEVRADRPVGAGQLLISYLEEFLISLMRGGGDERGSRASVYSKKNVENTLVEQIERYIEENVYNEITLKNICDRFRMSRSYLCRLFKENSGGSMIDYSIHAKITEAKKLIRRGELNFTQISEELCYSSIHHFTRSFKKVTGLTPTAYAKSVNG